MTTTAIPTRYSGVQFRSRLEARWAAFFDLCGWRWDYEPLDLDGYIPDFVLGFARPLLVEVKPFMWVTGDDVRTAKDKISKSGWEHEALIVGAVMKSTGGSQLDMVWDYVIGVMCDRTEASHHDWWADAFAFQCSFCNQRSLAHSEGFWACRVCSRSDGDHHLNLWNTASQWNEAGNRVQWRRRN